jgi:hypothetical protein
VHGAHAHGEARIGGDEAREAREEGPPELQVRARVGEAADEAARLRIRGEHEADGQFVGGAADLRVTVLEFASQKVLSRFEVHGQPDQVIKYAVKPGESKAVEAALAVHSSMWVDARKKLFDGLTKRGATITLR